MYLFLVSIATDYMDIFYQDNTKIVGITKKLFMGIERNRVVEISHTECINWETYVCWIVEEYNAELGVKMSLVYYKQNGSIEDMKMLGHKVQCKCIEVSENEL